MHKYVRKKWTLRRKFCFPLNSQQRFRCNIQPFMMVMNRNFPFFLTPDCHSRWEMITEYKQQIQKLCLSSFINSIQSRYFRTTCSGIWQTLSTMIYWVLKNHHIPLLSSMSTMSYASNAHLWWRTCHCPA